MCSFVFCCVMLYSVVSCSVGLSVVSGREGMCVTKTKCKSYAVLQVIGRDINSCKCLAERKRVYRNLLGGTMSFCKLNPSCPLMRVSDQAVKLKNPHASSREGIVPAPSPPTVFRVSDVLDAFQTKKDGRKPGKEPETEAKEKRLRRK